jgi:hypothetical protein
MSYGYGNIFNDVSQVWAGGLTYDKMVERTKTIKPYRGGLSNAYPMGWREYSRRHFRANKDGSFSIYYKNRESVDVVESGNFKEGWDKESLTKWVDHCHLATVYPDNTFEIRQHLGQGDSTYMSEAFGYWFQSCGARGGTIAWNRVGHMHPIFKGMRLHLDPEKKRSGETVTPYTTFQRRVNRKLAQEALGKYDEFLKVAPVMTGAMSKEGIMETIKDLVNDKTFDRKNPETAMANFERLVQSHRLVDAAVLFMLANNVHHVIYSAFHETRPHLGGYWGSSHSPEREVELFNVHLKQALSDVFKPSIIKAFNAFDLKELKAGTVLPKSKWGYIIKSDGTPVIRL